MNHLLTALFGLLMTFSNGLFAQLDSDETVIFFPALGSKDHNSEDWLVSIHGWVFEQKASTVRSKLLERTLRKKYKPVVGGKSSSLFNERIQPFLVDNERGKRFTVAVAGETHRLNSSGANGHFYGELKIAGDKVLLHKDGDRLPFSLLMPDTDDRDFSGVIHLIGSEGLSVISDIDDTIKISHVKERSKLIESTFFKEFEPVAGMASLYTKIQQTQGAFFHLVSSSPWQLYPSLQKFIRKAGFPEATFFLKYVRLKDKTFNNLFKPGIETKPDQIEPILNRYPQRRFILIGDSGEQDPEIYALMAKRYPRQIVKIFIRNIDTDIDNERYIEAFSEIDSKKWQVFNKVDEIVLP